jgi:chromosomal replication initiator protein
MDETQPAQVASRRISRHLAERIGHHTYDMWFGDTTRLKVEGTCVRVATDSRFVADWIKDHFREALDGAARKALGEQAQVELRVAPDQFAPSGDGADTGDGACGGPADRNGAADTRAVGGRRGRRRHRSRGLRHLEDFVVGPSNKLAFTAARRIAESASGSASPLFLYGDCGVGKTHLLQGIARRFAQRCPARGPAAVRYVTAEQFTNEYINAVRGNTIARFRRRTRRLELLAIDDVHFLANKVSTQNEFLHTVDAIELSGSRLALASDEHPLRLGFNRALSSRLAAGMVARIERPDRTTRITLAGKLAAACGVSLSAAAAERVADRCTGSVRELEGALNKLAALRLVSGRPDDAEIGLVLVERLFEDGGWRPKAPLRITSVMDVVCARMTVSRAELMGSGRHRRVVTARGLVAWLGRELTTLSYPEIAAALGRNHHSTVHTGAARIARQLTEQRRVEVGDGGEALPLNELVDQLRHEILKAARG